MCDKLSIGIVGLGFVGGALEKSFKLKIETKIE
jgi:hypothetical protein